MKGNYELISLTSVCTLWSTIKRPMVNNVPLREHVFMIMIVFTWYILSGIIQRSFISLIPVYTLTAYCTCMFTWAGIGLLKFVNKLLHIHVCVIFNMYVGLQSRSAFKTTPYTSLTVPRMFTFTSTSGIPE